MSRLEKKCLFASAATHALLMGLLFLTPAFAVSKKPMEHLPLLNFIPAIAVDQKIFSGGSPNVTQPPAPPPRVEEIRPALPQPPAEVQPPEPVREPLPQPKSDPTPPEVSRSPPRETTLKTPPTINPRPSSSVKAPPKSTGRTNAVTTNRRPSARSNAAQKAQASAQAEAQARAQAQKLLASRIGQALGNLERGLTPGTSVEAPGPGGAAFANYRLLVQAAYEQAWLPPQEVSAATALVRAEVVIARDGTVLSKRIEKRSGVPAVDKSVQDALELKRVPAFPEGAKDLQRTFIINFDLKTKQPFG